MIFELHYLCIMAGYSAAGLLLGRFFMLYAGANQFELGLVFMIQPAMTLLRPLISAKADRDSSHKRLLCLCLLVNSLAYVPFVVIPFLLEQASVAPYLSERVNFWVFVVGHFFGSVAFCGVRTLGDTLAVNYAKRTGSDFAAYRKYGAMSFGLCAYGLGFVNENWIMPDYVASHIANVVALFALMLTMHFWRDEDFVVVSESQLQRASGSPASSCGGVAPPAGAQHAPYARNAFSAAHNSKLTLSKFEGYGALDDNQSLEARQGPRRDHISASQQLKILWVLVKRDHRIPLFLLLVFYGGFVGYSGPNFVFTYMGIVCDQTKQCDGAMLSGITMVCYCFAETLFYMLIKKLGDRVSHLTKLNISLASLALHYLFYGYALQHVSPYFFLVEMLHGLEYSISLTSSVELAYKFANEIELVMPELLQRGIVAPHEDLEKVQVSLIATMNSIFTLVYDGIGSILGVLVYGIIIEDYSYPVAFAAIGFLSLFGLVASMLVACMGKCVGLRPQILNYQHPNHRHL